MRRTGLFGRSGSLRLTTLLPLCFIAFCHPGSEHQEASKQSICSKPQKTLLKKSNLYQWQAPDGSWQFSDSPPRYKTAEVKTKQLTSANAFKLNLDRQHAALNAFTEDAIRRDVNTINRILRRDLGLKDIPPITLNLKLFDSTRVFNRYKNRVAPRMGNAGGFFIPALNEATVFTTQSPARMHAVIRHEATHAINFNTFGRLPIWLNEGLAEYFEQMEFQYGNHVRIKPNTRHLEHITGYPDKIHLHDFLRVHHTRWYSKESQRIHYALAWSIGSFLFSSTENKLFLKRFLEHYAANYCRPVDPLALINRYYPGGFEGFEKKWVAFLQVPIGSRYY